MSDIHPYEWWLERIEVARTESDTPGARSFFGQCPVHFFFNDTHTTEKNGKAQVHCFGCSAKYSEIIDALDTVSESPSEASQASESEASGIVVVRRQSKATAGSPLDWCAQRCGMTRAQLDDLSLPLSERGDRLIFEFDGRAEKTLVVGEGKKKEIAWVGTLNPPLWPVPTEPLPEEITITEGEFDCIVLRASGYDAFSITGGSTNPPDVSAFVALKAMGVERVVVAFDEDEAGRKARSAVTESIRSADLVAIYGRPKGLEPLYDEKDARDVAARLGTVELEDHPDTELDVQMLSAVVPAPDRPLLLERLDPDDHTIMFGDGSAGKGMIASWWASCLTRGWGTRVRGTVTEVPIKVLILDYESHAETEWVKRVSKFGGDPDKIVIVSPKAAIWDIAGSVTELIKEMKIDYVMVDSAMYACIGADAYTPEGATQYTAAIKQFKRPVLTLAHKTKSKDEQDKPFGSVFWHNGARLTISVDAKGYDDPREVKTRKSNHGDDFHVDIEWSWVSKGLPQELIEMGHAGKVTIRTRILNALSNGPMTSGEIRIAVDGDGEGPAKNVPNTLLGMKGGDIDYDPVTKEYSLKEVDA